MAGRELFSKGKRGLIYTAAYKGKKAAIKVKNPESRAVERIKNEAQYLKKLNKYKIGPKFISFRKNELMYEFVEGMFILDFIGKNAKKEIKMVVKDVFGQMFILDKLGIDKEEMHHPLKHVIVNSKNKTVLIDFERCHKTLKPKNVTQWCQFLISYRRLLNKKGIKINKNRMIGLARNYKKNQNKTNMDKIIGGII